MTEPNGNRITASGYNREGTINEALNNINMKSGADQGVPNNPLLKNWQELSVKRALKEAVDNNSEYFSWINGEQTSARYNLATKVKSVDWGKTTSVKEPKIVTIASTEGKEYVFWTNEKGSILSGQGSRNVPNDWQGKKLNEVLGKGLADKIMEKPSGKLSGEGLKFGGEWADNLYDKQVKNIVEDVTGGRVESIKLSGKLTNGETGKKSIMELPGEQQAIRLTPEIKARIKGESLKLRK